MDKPSTHKTGNLRFCLDFIRNSAVMAATLPWWHKCRACLKFAVAVLIDTELYGQFLS